MLSTKGIVSLISISRPPPMFLWRPSCSCPFGRLQRLCIVHQLGFLDSGNDDIVAVEEG